MPDPHAQLAARLLGLLRSRTFVAHDASFDLSAEGTE
jgi:hypothetical protein